MLKDSKNVKEKLKFSGIQAQLIGSCFKLRLWLLADALMSHSQC